MVVEAHRHGGVFIARGKEDALVTKNMVPGQPRPLPMTEHEVLQHRVGVACGQGASPCRQEHGTRPTLWGCLFLE